MMLIGWSDGVGQEAQFNRVTGLIQRTNQHYIVVDHDNHCLRNIRYIDNGWRASTFAGRCTSEGNSDGPLLDARFHEPIYMLQFCETIIVAEYGGKSIRQIDLSSEKVNTIHKSEVKLLSFVFGEKLNEFYVVVEHGVMHLADGAETWLAGGNSRGSSLGDFRVAKFNTPTDIKWLDGNTFLVVDYANHVLKVLHLESERVSQICAGKLLYNKKMCTNCNCKIYCRKVVYFSRKLY